MSDYSISHNHLGPETESLGKGSAKLLSHFPIPFPLLTRLEQKFQHQSYIGEFSPFLL